MAGAAPDCFIGRTNVDDVIPIGGAYPEYLANIFGQLAKPVLTLLQRLLRLDALNSQGKPLKGSQVLILGTAYKPDIDDLRESPALDVIGLLLEKGARVQYHDPHIARFDHDGMQMDSVPDLMTAVRASDCVVIITNHSAYDYPMLLEAAPLIVDSRNALKGLRAGNEKVVSI